jgi:acetyltransferase-like isoleucine patch superfamily enzyme
MSEIRDAGKGRPEQHSSMISNHAIVEPGAILGSGVQIWHFTHIREGVAIGDDTNVGSHCYIDVRVRIGSRCKVQSGCLIYGPTIIGNGVFIGPGVKIINDKNPRAVDDEGRKLTAADWVHEGVTIEDGASIGTGSILMPGIRIGRNARIGAGSVVTKDVASQTLVFGIAARAPAR